MFEKRFDISKLDDNNSSYSQTNWLTSFADLISIIITFFVLVYSMSEIPSKKWQEISSSIVEFIRGDKINIKLEKNLKKKSFEKKEVLRIVYDKDYINNVINEVILDDGDFSNSVKDKVIEIKTSAKKISFFISKEAILDDTDLNNLKLKSLGQNIIYDLSKILKILGNQVEVAAFDDEENRALKISDFIAGKIEELGYEYKALRIYNNESNSSENKIGIIIKSYETVY